jgi:hypothetical protein
VAGAAKAPPSIEMNLRRRMCPRALNHSRLRNGNVDETAHNEPLKPIRLNIWFGSFATLACCAVL